MKSYLIGLIERGLEKKVPATGLAVFRILFGLVIFQEILYLTHFRHLIFDRVPFIETAGPIVPLSLLLWLGLAVCLIFGLFTFVCSIANYVFWVLFVLLTPMWRDFDGGFDQLMTSSSFILIFVRSERRFSLDNLRWKLGSPGKFAGSPSEPRIPVIYYYVLVGVSLGLLYFDAALHKLHSEIWMNGLGAWVPNTMPYYISPLNFDWFVNSRGLQEMIGYSLTVFQLVFLFVFTRKAFRIPILIFGVFFHLGIILCLNIYPFGFGMLVHYALLVPFSWWMCIGGKIVHTQPFIQTYCNAADRNSLRLGLVLQHFDFRHYSTFHFVSGADELPAIIRNENPDLRTFTLLSLDRENRLYPGCAGFRPKIYFTVLLFAFRLGETVQSVAGGILYRFPFRRQRQFAPTTGPDAKGGSPALDLSPRVLLRFLVVVFILQMNSTLYYGISKRSTPDVRDRLFNGTIMRLSVYVTSVSHSLLGITPHALYMDDHFGGYKQITAFTYIDSEGSEKWLPFIAQDGRFISPNWGRVHSMWANVAMHPPFNPPVFERLAKKVTAYWAGELGIGAEDSSFHVKTKPVQISYRWIKDLRRKNLQGVWSDFAEIRWVDEKFSINYVEGSLK